VLQPVGNEIRIDQALAKNSPANSAKAKSY
jgi:hypothetical protein